MHKQSAIKKTLAYLVTATETVMNHMSLTSTCPNGTYDGK